MKQLELLFTTAPPVQTVGTTRGQQQMLALVEHLKNNPIRDVVRQGMDLSATYNVVNNKKGLPVLHIEGDSFRYSVHSHAFGQLCSKLHFAHGYARGLFDEKEEWAYQLAVDNINKLLDMRCANRKFLLRTVNGQVRGFLTNAYGRFDTIKLINTFSKSCLEVGAVPFDSFWGDLRIAVQGALERVYVAAGQKLQAGVMLKHSDFGLGAMEVRFFISVNGYPMVGRSGMRKVHKGKRLKEDSDHNDAVMSSSSAELSKKMHTLIHQHLADENISAVMAEVELAGSTEIDVSKLSDVLMGLELTDEEAKRVANTFETDDKLPPGSTLLRLASTIAWAAGLEPDVERKLELMEMAGSLIMKEKH
jgi:hypothetical protein